MDEIERKNELLQVMATMEIRPADVDTELAVQPYGKFPLSRITALGVGLEPVVAAVQKVVNSGQSASGFYKVTLPVGTHLAQFKGGVDFLGTALSDSTNALAGQAHLTPLICDPTMLFMAATFANIDKKLNSIQETQREMMDFIIQKEKSDLKGDLVFLQDVFDSYKYNWNNDKYKMANHIKALDVRHESGKRIDFHREQIKKCLEKKALFHRDQDVQRQIAQVQDELGDYQLSLYLYGFSSFIEVLLQENFDFAYLNSISTKMDELSVEYRELYSEAYSRIEVLAKTSLQGKIMDGFSNVSKVTGETIAKIPGISKSHLDETLIETGEKISIREEKRSMNIMCRLVDRQSSCIRPFINQIDTINQVYNSPMALIFNKDTLYLGPADT